MKPERAIRDLSVVTVLIGIWPPKKRLKKSWKLPWPPPCPRPALLRFVGLIFVIGILGMGVVGRGDCGDPCFRSAWEGLGVDVDHSGADQSGYLDEFIGRNRRIDDLRGVVGAVDLLLLPTDACARRTRPRWRRESGSRTNTDARRRERSRSKTIS